MHFEQRIRCSISPPRLVPWRRSLRTTLSLPWQTFERSRVGSNRRVLDCKTSEPTPQMTMLTSNCYTMSRRDSLRAGVNCRMTARGVHSQLSVDDGLIIYRCRLVIPRGMRQQVLKQLHESHQGLVRTKLRAGLMVYWPGITNDIDRVISTCTLCCHPTPQSLLFLNHGPVAPSRS